MVKVLSGGKQLYGECERCGTQVSYVFSDLRMRHTTHMSRGLKQYGAYRYIECPNCKENIRYKV